MYPPDTTPGHVGAPQTYNSACAARCHCASVAAAQPCLRLSPSPGAAVPPTTAPVETTPAKNHVWTINKLQTHWPVKGSVDVMVETSGDFCRCDVMRTCTVLLLETSWNFSQCDGQTVHENMYSIVTWKKLESYDSILLAYKSSATCFLKTCSIFVMSEVLFLKKLYPTECLCCFGYNFCFVVKFWLHP